MSEKLMYMIGGIPMIDIKLWNRSNNAYQTALLVLDTGAAITTISNDIFHMLGYDTQSKEKKRVTTASGIEYVDEVILDKIMIAGIELTDVTAYAHTFPQESFTDGVIGMNVLSNFDLFASFQRKTLKLTFPA